MKRAAALAGLGLVGAPPHVWINRWIERYGAGVMGSQALPLQLLHRMTVLSGIYDTFLEHDHQLQEGSPLVRLLTLQEEGKISQEDYDLIYELINTDQYKKR